jgi:hypothetical protein
MQGSFVVFARPVAGIAAGEPIRVCPENAHILEQAARQDLTYEKVGNAWRDGNTFFRRAGGKTRGMAPVNN